MPRSILKAKILKTLGLHRYNIKINDKQRKTIAKSPLFDQNYYCLNARKFGYNLCAADALSHYIEIGDRRKLSTHPLFDTKYYYSCNHDLDEMPTTALYHFLEHGARELRSPHPYIDPYYIIRQIGRGSDNYLIDFLSCAPGTVNPHPLIDVSYIFEQWSSKIVTTNPFHDFCAGIDSHRSPSRKLDVNAFSKINKISKDINPLYLYLLADKVGNLDANNVPAQFANIDMQIEEAAMIEPSLDLRGSEVSDISIVRAYMITTLQSDIIRKIDLAMPKKPINHMIFASAASNPAETKLLHAALSDMLAQNRNTCLCLIIDGSGSLQLEEFMTGFDLTLIKLNEFTDQELERSFLKTFSVYLQTIIVGNLHVIDSEIGWKFLENFGRQARRFARLNAHVSGYERDGKGRRSGYAWTHLPECLSYLSVIHTSSQELLSELEAELASCEGDRCTLKIVATGTNSQSTKRAMPID